MVTYKGSQISLMSKQFKVKEKETDVQEMIIETVNKIKAENKKDAHIDIKDIKFSTYTEIYSL